MFKTKIDSYAGKCVVEKRINANGIILRGVGDTPEEARFALKQEKKKYQQAMASSLSHLYLKPKLDKNGNRVSVRSPGMIPYKLSDGSIGLRMDQNNRVLVLTRKQDVFVGVYKQEKKDGRSNKKDS